LYRDARHGWFSQDDRAFVAEIALLLAAQLRRSTRTAALPNGLDDVDEPGTLVLDRDLRLLAATPEARRWLDEVAPVVREAADPLPGFVYALAARVGALADGHAGPVRVCGPTGRWLVLRGAMLSSASPSVPAGSVVVTIEPARSSEIAPLLMQAWGLSAREREVASLVLDGLATEEIAAELFISQHTVRDHVRSVFDKVCVRSRRHLVAVLAGGSPSNRSALYAR
jgi:DNA-binding CsgD family transcriptional regulator